MGQRCDAEHNYRHTFEIQRHRSWQLFQGHQCLRRRMHTSFHENHPMKSYLLSWRHIYWQANFSAAMCPHQLSCFVATQYTTTSSSIKAHNMTRAYHRSTTHTQKYL
ncbi:uncharacterized protein LOC144452563 [Glandiceps talaboti]